MNKQNLLFELGVEELPAVALQKMEQSLYASVDKFLKNQGFEFDSLTTFATPRRLAFLIDQIEVQQPDKQSSVKGPKTNAPEAAIKGFANKHQQKIEDLKIDSINGQSHYVFQQSVKGTHIKSAIIECINQALQSLPIPKNMRWGDSAFLFSRPVRWVVLLLDDVVIPAELFGIQSANKTWGHRFHQGTDQGLVIDRAENYENVLKSAFVIANSAQRKHTIQGQLAKVAKQLDANVVVDSALLDEVNALVEWPVIIVGDFPERFLSMPKECLITTMSGNQKYFHVEDHSGQLMAKFITIANLESSDPACIKQGNERVIVPRLQDAEFFYNNDQQQPLMANYDKLSTMVFEKQLGTVLDKVERMAKLAKSWAEQVDADVAQTETAVRLSKCDLLSAMVTEFPSLQGIMGRYYATKEGHPPAVSLAIDEHYQPRFAGDNIPQNTLGQLVALADKMDTICGIFAIGKQPTGTSDPYALRRSTLGVLRILIEGSLNFDLAAMIEHSLKVHKRYEQALATAILHFMLDRLTAYYDELGYRPQIIQSVKVLGITVPLDFDLRMQAIKAFSNHALAEQLSGANKRIANILKKNPPKSGFKFDPKKLELAEEKSLHQQLEQHHLGVYQNYHDRLEALLTLNDAIDAFFDRVMVMTDDESVKHNRLALLQRLRNAFLSVADIAYLQV